MGDATRSRSPTRPIKSAFDAVGEILLNPDYVNAGFGDVKSIDTHPVRRPGDGARRRRLRRCTTRRRSTTASSRTPDGNASAEDGDIWAFLHRRGDEAGAAAVTGGGEIVAAFSNDADTIKVQEYLSSPEWANSRVSASAASSAPTRASTPTNASSPILQEAIEILQDPTTPRSASTRPT